MKDPLGCDDSAVFSLLPTLHFPAVLPVSSSQMVSSPTTTTLPDTFLVIRGTWVSPGHTRTDTFITGCGTSETPHQLESRSTVCGLAVLWPDHLHRNNNPVMSGPLCVCGGGGGSSSCFILVWPDRRTEPATPQLGLGICIQNTECRIQNTDDKLQSSLNIFC